MNRKHTASSIWQRAIGQLDDSFASRMSLEIERLTRTHLHDTTLGEHTGIAVSVIDRTSSQTASVAWSDPQGCRYGDQVWRIATAKKIGRCVLTGKTIGIGDAIYRPRKAEPPPANADAMILASELHDAVRPDDDDSVNQLIATPAKRECAQDDRTACLA